MESVLFLLRSRFTELAKVFIISPFADKFSKEEDGCYGSQAICTKIEKTEWAFPKICTRYFSYSMKSLGWGGWFMLDEAA